MRNPASVMMVSLIIIGMLTFAFNIQPTIAEGSLLLEMVVSKTLINIGEEIDINLTLRNVGETTITLTYPYPPWDAYYCTQEGCYRYSDDKYYIPIDWKLTLEPGENYTEMLHWDLYQFVWPEYYPPEPGTYSLTGLCYVAGLDYSITVKLIEPWWNPADVNQDLKVDMFDIAIAAGAYKSTLSDPNWNPNCDIAEPYEVIDILDIVAIAGSYGEEYSP